MTSKRHPEIVRLRRLMSRARDRAADDVFVAEGRRTIDEIVSHGLLPRMVVVADDVPPNDVPPLLDGGRTFRVRGDVVNSVADSQTPQGIIAEFDRPATAAAWPEVVDLAVVLDGLADPGNVGTIVRSAAAFGAAVALVMPGADPWSPKAVRAGAGAHAVVPIVTGGWPDIADLCDDRGLTIVGLDGSGTDLQPSAGRAFIVGNEAHGLSVAGREVADHLERIPIHTAVESLNAAMAASIALATSRLATGLG